MSYDVEKAARKWVEKLKVPKYGSTLAHERDALLNAAYAAGARQYRDALVEGLEALGCVTHSTLWVTQSPCEKLGRGEHVSWCPIAIADALREGRMP